MTASGTFVPIEQCDILKPNGQLPTQAEHYDESPDSVFQQS